MRRPPAGLGAFLGVAVLTVVAHTLAATFTSLWVATAGEARFAVGVLAIRDATVADVPLAPWDHLAAIQYRRRPAGAARGQTPSTPPAGPGSPSARSPPC